MIYIYYNADGRIVSHHPVKYDNADVYIEVADADALPNYVGYYVDQNLTIQPIPPAPNSNCVFDYTTKTWVDNTTLEQAQQNKTNEIELAYEAACVASVSYATAGGITQVFQADPDSQSILISTISALSATQTTPDSFYWKAADNTLVPFVYSDLTALSKAIWAQAWVAFQNKTIKKAAIRAATTVAEVRAITW